MLSIKSMACQKPDWAITPKVYIKGKRVKDFDYEIPMYSDGRRFIQIENKGCTVVDNNLKTSGVSQNIQVLKKKRDNTFKSSQNIYYGTIEYWTITIQLRYG